MTDQGMAPGAALPELRLAVASLPQRKPRRFSLRPDAAGLAAMAQALEILSLDRFVMEGEITPEGRADFRLTARIEGAARQACAITLAPVPAVFDERIDRLYKADLPEIEAEETEVPDEDIEALPGVLDLVAIAIEAILLALPAYPRAPGAELGEVVHSGPGIEALRDDDLKPFAGLAALIKRE